MNPPSYGAWATAARCSVAYGCPTMSARPFGAYLIKRDVFDIRNSFPPVQRGGILRGSLGMFFGRDEFVRVVPTGVAFEAGYFLTRRPAVDFDVSGIDVHILAASRASGSAALDVSSILLWCESHVSAS